MLLPGSETGIRLLTPLLPIYGTALLIYLMGVVTLPLSS